MDVARSWRGAVRLGKNGVISGFVYDLERWERRFVVELQIDGESITLAGARLFDADLHKQSIGDGCYGFAFPLPTDLERGSRLAIVLPNTDELIGAVAYPSGPEIFPAVVPLDGVRWVGGLRFEAWLEASPTEKTEGVLAMIDGETVAVGESICSAPVCSDNLTRTALRFQVFLPGRFADGVVRQAKFTTKWGRELTGSPCSFVAFEGNRCPTEKIAGNTDIISALRPMQGMIALQGVPFSEFSSWLQAYPNRADPNLPEARVAVVLLGQGDLQVSLTSLEGQTNCKWVAAAIAELGDGVALDSEHTVKFLENEGAECDYILFAPSGVAFDVHALALLAAALINAPSKTIAYCDWIVRAEDDSLWPIAFPAFDLERLLEQGYAARLFVAGRSQGLATLREGAGDDVFRLFFSLLEGADCPTPIHVPEFLITIRGSVLDRGGDKLEAAARSYLEAIGVEAQFESARKSTLFPHIHVKRSPAQEAISIIVAAGGAIERITSCLNSVFNELRDYEAEAFLIADADSLAALPRMDGPIHFKSVRAGAGLMSCANVAIGASSGELLVFLDPEFGEFEAGGLDELLGRISADGVGAVGPLCIGNAGTVVEGGFVLGPGFAVASAFEGHHIDAPSYGDLLSVAHEVSAIGVAGMVTRKTLFRDCDGFDLARFRRRFADVDYCLKLRARGIRIVLAPAAKQIVRRPRIRTVSAASNAYIEDMSDDAELRELRSRWGEALVADPSYNPNLGIDMLYSGLAWHPRPRRARLPIFAPPRRTPIGL